MADTKITALTALTAADPANDVIPIVDVSDTSMAASGTTKKISVNNILGASGTATLASATITGAATVGTTLGVTGASTLASVGVTGAATVGTTLGVTGNITGSGADPNFNNGSLNLFLSGGTTGDPAISFARFGSASLNNRGAKIQYVYRTASAQESGSLAFYSNPDSAGTGSLVERMRIDYSGDVNISTGNVVMATSGKGIDFSATSGTGTSELLNDYEEGTWTATLTGTTTNPTIPVTATGKYTKIGRQVHVHLYLNNVITTGASGGISITGLPFTVASGYDQIGSLMIDSMATFTNSSLSAYLSGGATSFSVFTSTSNSNITAATHNAGTGRYLWASITYTV